MPQLDEGDLIGLMFYKLYRRRMEDEVAAIQAAQEALEAAEALAAQEASENNSLLSPCMSSIKSPGSLKY